MKEIRLNPTPVRTSENYLINDWKKEETIFPPVKPWNQKIWEVLDDKNVEITNAVSAVPLTYGMGKEAEAQIKQQANVAMKVEWKQSSSTENFLHFHLDENNPALVENIELVVPSHCEGKVTILYTSAYNNSEAQGFHHGVLRAHVEENATLQVTVVNLLSSSTTSLLSMENILEKEAKLTYCMVDFGGDSSLTNYYSELKGDNSENELNTIYLGNGHQVFDMNYIAATKGKNTKMKMDVQGAIQDQCRKHFKGTIDFKRGSKKAVGEEKEFCMLLSDTAKSISLPMLLCDEEDVVGNHAAAAGKVNHKELFYLMSRGLSEKEAKTLLVKAKFQSVLQHIADDNLKERVLQEIDTKLEVGEG